MAAAGHDPGEPSTVHTLRLAQTPVCGRCDTADGLPTKLQENTSLASATERDTVTG